MATSSPVPPDTRLFFWGTVNEVPLFCLAHVGYSVMQTTVTKQA